MKNKSAILFTAVMAIALLSALVSPAAELFVSKSRGIAETIHFRMSMLGWGAYQDVRDAGINADSLLAVPKWRSQMEIRPDFYFVRDRLDLAFKPRFLAHFDQWDDGTANRQKHEGEGEIYVNEWMSRFRIADNMFISAGRENLQWGPSILLSPSNPFYRNNGRNNPSLELPGLDYVSGVFLPGRAWTVSLIVNVGESRENPLKEFRNVYAVKLDFTGEEKYFSLIGSRREGEKAALGFFTGMSLSEAILIHGEGSLSAEEGAADILAGGGYTLVDGSVISVEYFRQGNGCPHDSLLQCLASQDFFRALARRRSHFSGTIDDIIAMARDLEIGPDRISFLRKNYLLLQYVRPRIRDVLSLTVRFTYNMDDNSSRLICLANYELNNHMELFGVGNLFMGSGDTEYGCLINHTLMVGITVKI